MPYTFSILSTLKVDVISGHYSDGINAIGYNKCNQHREGFEAVLFRFMILDFDFEPA
jgi:hypothetical protein